MIEILRNRFQHNMTHHPDLTWECVEARLRENDGSLDILRRTEETGGEPDAIGFDEDTGKLIFCDCAAETPAGRRSLFYDDEALRKRTRNPPVGSAVHQAQEMGVQLLTEALYCRPQELGSFDGKASSWIAIPRQYPGTGRRPVL